MTQTVRTGHRRHRVSFFEPAKRGDSINQQVEHPVAVLENVPAAIKNLGGDEEQRGSQIVAGATCVVETAFFYSVEIKPSMFILFPRYMPGNATPRRLNILRTIDPDFTRRQLLHYCKEEPLADG